MCTPILIREVATMFGIDTANNKTGNADSQRFLTDFRLFRHSNEVYTPVLIKEVATLFLTTPCEKLVQRSNDVHTDFNQKSGNTVRYLHDNS